MLNVSEYEKDFYATYADIMKTADKLSVEQSLDMYEKLLNGKPIEEKRIIEKVLCKLDLFYLLAVVLNQRGKEKMTHRWLYDRIRMVQMEPDFCLDLWSRAHFKTTILTIGQTIRDILNNPSVSICLVSFNTSTAEDLFLKPIKEEFEKNKQLKYLFPEIFPDYIYKNNWKNASITVARPAGRESTVTAYGLDNIQTGRHYDIVVMDDVINENSVSTDEQIRKTYDNYSSIQALGHEDTKWRMIGTTYHVNDIYNTVINNGDFKLRKFPARENGLPDGKLCFMSESGYKKYTKRMTNKTIACQMLLDPAGMGQRTFDIEWLKYYNFRDRIDRSAWNIYILVDPAVSLNTRADYTVMVVVAVGVDGNYYICDIVRDRLKPSQKAHEIYKLATRWKPNRIGWETTAQNTDIYTVEKYFQDNLVNYQVIPLKANSTKSKVKRIEVLEPLFRENKIWLPPKGTIINEDIYNNKYDPIEQFINSEYIDFPLSEHDDMLDALSRIADPEMKIIVPTKQEKGAVGSVADYSIFDNYSNSELSYY